MDQKIQAVGNDMSTLAEDARALMAATKDVTGEKVAAARQRLAAALESGKAIYGQVREKAIAGVQSTGESVRDNPYQAIGIALGIGAVIGFLVARRCSRNDD